MATRRRGASQRQTPRARQWPGDSSSVSLRTSFGWRRSINFEVEGDHTYFVAARAAESGIWVHNNKPCAAAQKALYQAGLYGDIIAKHPSTKGQINLDHIPSVKSVQAWLESQGKESKAWKDFGITKADDITRARIEDKLATVAVDTDFHRKYSRTFGGRQHSRGTTPDTEDLRRWQIDAQDLKAAANADIARYVNEAKKLKGWTKADVAKLRKDLKKVHESIRNWVYTLEKTFPGDHMPAAAEKSVIARLKKLGCEVIAGSDSWDVRLGNVPLDAAIDDICQLKSVALELSRLKEPHHAMLSRLVNVTHIVSDHCSFCDRSFSYLADLPRLVSITIFVSAPADIIGVGIGKLAKTQLESLTIHGSALSDQGAWEIAEIGSLQSVEIFRGAITDVALESFRRLQLESLSLADLKVSDVGLKEIAAMESLKYLFLSDLQITDAGLSHLENLQSLEVLDISCSSVSEEAVQALIMKLPNVDS